MGETEEVQKEKQVPADPAMENDGASRPTKADYSIHQWFAALSVEERARALGFQDGTMFSIILKHALLASSFVKTIPESRTDKKGEQQFRLSMSTFLLSGDSIHPYPGK